MKRLKDYYNRERLVELGSSTLQQRRIRDNLIETFKIINGIFNYGWHFSIFSLPMEILKF